jgi:hypothetical protein
MEVKACTGTSVEAGRIGLLVARDGEEATRDWVRRTLAIYRRAVLDPGQATFTGKGDRTA